MQTYSQALTAATPYVLNWPGKYFRLISVAAALKVEFLRNNTVIYTGTDVEAGFWAIPDDGFHAIRITSATAQTAKFGVSEGGGGYDPTSVQTTIKSATVISAPVSVTVDATGADLLIAADTTATRRLAIFRNAGAVTVYIGGADVSSDSAIALAPGEVWIEDIAPAAAWYGLAASATAAVKVTTYA